MYDLSGYYAANPSQAPKPRLGSLSRLVERLLMDPQLTYEQIVAEARRQYPTAETSTRSVASVACVMRRKGTPVPMRVKVKPRQLNLI